MEFQIRILVLAILCGVTVWAEQARFDNYRVYSIKVENEEQLTALKNIENNPQGYYFWEYPTEMNRTVDIVVPPGKMKEFNGMVKTNQMKPKLKHNNMQKLIDNERPPQKSRAGFGWTDYYSLDDIYAWLDTIVSQHSDIASTVIGGKSHEGRDIKGVKIEFNKAFKSVVIEANIHAREWITSATATWLINEILTNQDRGVLGEYNWYIFPMINPDGFVYTHTSNRMWRKTRSRNVLCVGADPNRNWGYNFMQGGASNFECSDTFAGKSAFSEIETKTFSEYLKTVPNMEIYLDFHAYSQLLMVPYGHTKQHLDNYDEAVGIGKKAATALSKRYGTQYKVGNIAETIYVASGGSIDWVKGELKTRLSYAFEFRDTGKHGFLLPADQIIPNSEEVLDAVKVILEEAKN